METFVVWCEECGSQGYSGPNTLCSGCYGAGYYKLPISHLLKVDKKNIMSEYWISERNKLEDLS